MNRVDRFKRDHNPTLLNQFIVSKDKFRVAIKSLENELADRPKLF